jgi:amino acid transporter
MLIFSPFISEKNMSNRLPNTLPGRESQKDLDRRQLHGFGYAQQLFRDMGGFSNFAISFSIISILTGAVTLYGYGLNAGGPLEMTLGWPLVTIFTLSVAAGLAQLASAFPTAGAMYHWAALLGGPGWGWFTAWFNFTGQFAILAGISFGCAEFMTPLLGLETTYANKLIVYTGILLSQAVLNHIGIGLVARLNDFSAWYHIFGGAILVGALLFWAPKQPTSFLIKSDFTTLPYPYWWAFLLGLLQAQWTYTGYDASAHITEETVDPSRNAPWGLFNSVAVSAVFGYVMLLVVTLSIQDLPVAAAAANPFIHIIETALGTTFGRMMLWMVTLAMWFCGLSSVTSNSRMIFAFARDGGMPASPLWSRISKKYRTPAPAIWLAVGVAFLIAVYSRAYSVIVSISTIGLYVSYGIPILLGLIAQRNGKWNHRGPWHLGKWSVPNAAIAALWIAFICVLFVAPPNQLTGYTFAGLTTVLIIYYLVSVRHWFRGPQRMGTEEELLAVEKALEKD